MDGLVYVLIGFAIAGFLFWKVASQPPPPPRAEMICPHCQAKGTVTVTRVSRKQGISGGKATGALFTGGVSMLATGLSRKQQMNHGSCSNCRVEWDFG